MRRLSNKIKAYNGHTLNSSHVMGTLYEVYKQHEAFTEISISHKQFTLSLLSVCATVSLKILAFLWSGGL